MTSSSKGVANHLQYILALDQGTTSSRALLIDQWGRVAAMGQRDLSQRYPQPGWVEHDPEEIWFTEWASIQDCLRQMPEAADHIVGIGIANQRETTILWERTTGKPVHHAIVWQCRRTAAACQSLQDAGYGPLFFEKTGLVLDPYFSGTKVAWLLDHVPGLRARAEAGEILFGTVDSWLVYQLTGGALHVTDPSNASRTLMYNIHTMDWDDQLLEILRIPRGMCPRWWIRPALWDSPSGAGLAAKSPFPASPETSRPPCLGRDASAPEWPKTHTAPDPLCS